VPSPTRNKNRTVQVIASVTQGCLLFRKDLT